MRKNLNRLSDRLTVLMLGSTATAFSGALGAMGQEHRKQEQQFQKSRLSYNRDVLGRMEKIKSSA